MSDIEKAFAYFQGISTRDPALAVKYVDPKRYIEHNPQARDGVEGLTEYVDRIAADRPELKVIRAYQDGSYVFTHTDGLVLGDSIFFDVFRFEGGLIVEHWVFASKGAPPNKSGHTQIDGPTEANLDEDAEQNKSLVRSYYETVHIGGRHDMIPRYFSGDRQDRHEPGVADGLGAFLRDLAVLTHDRTIDRIGLFMGQNDFVFLAAEGTHLGEPCAYIDLYRCENEKMVEHWGFPQPFPSLDSRKNDNGML